MTQPQPWREQPTQPGVPPMPGGQMPPVQPIYVPMQAPPTVTRTKVGGSAHTVHLVLTVCSCGAWAPVWFLHWLFTRSKTVTR